MRTHRPSALLRMRTVDKMWKSEDTRYGFD